VYPLAAILPLARDEDQHRAAAGSASRKHVLVTRVIGVRFLPAVIYSDAGDGGGAPGDSPARRP
jgi:hypothetical protein